MRGGKRRESGSVVQPRGKSQHWSKKVGAGGCNEGAGKVSQEVNIDSRLKILKPSVVETILAEGGKTSEGECNRIMGLDEPGKERGGERRGPGTRNSLVPSNVIQGGDGEGRQEEPKLNSWELEKVERAMEIEDREVITTMQENDRPPLRELSQNHNTDEAYQMRELGKLKKGMWKRISQGEKKLLQNADHDKENLKKKKGKER